jgi:tetratricopeptide (TPR) repeat protein
MPSFVASLVLTLLLTLGRGLAPASAAAQEPSAEVPGYREAVTEALAEFDAGHFLEARRHFTRAHELFPNARTLRGLGVVAYELRHYADSVRFCEQALAARTKPLEGPLREGTERLLVRARNLVAQLTIRAQPASTQVAVDGATPRPLSAAPMLLDPGDHQLEFEAPGFAPERRALTVIGGESESWKIALRSLRPDGTAEPRSERARPMRARWKAGLAGGAMTLGGASLVAAGVLTAKRREKGEQQRALDSIDPALEPALRQWRDSRSKPYVFGTLGAAALTSGALGLLLSAPREAFPWWATAASGIAGAGLATWGVMDVLGGGSCELEPAVQRSCSEDLERRDRGAVVLLASAPLLALSVTQLLRLSLGSSARADGRKLALQPRFDARHKSVLLDARVAW